VGVLQEGTKSEPARAATAAHGSESSEKVELFQPAIELSIWTIAVFVVLLMILRVLAWKPMQEGLQKREHGIQRAIDEARKARDEAQQLREQWQREMDRANEKVGDILDHARRDAQNTTEEMVAKARTEIQAERDRLRREIETARDQAIQQLWNQTADLATLVSAKAIRRQLTPDDHRRLVDEALNELGHVANGPHR
jgi:F-type H+-transporting ATPase subunit b